MPWPTPQEYNEAIQNPHLCFADPELRLGMPELTALGLPRPITGNFASVYRVRCGARDWAVRCFWRETADLQLRYEAISRHLRACKLPYTVGFDYLDQGICVRGTWFPILKMEWVEGEVLSVYVERHLQDPGILSQLAEAWRSMMAALEGCSIAHGDLQHGNVLVVGGHLKLVDYDCMFVPTLAGRSSHELGHQNYQHPARGPLDFGPYLDRFSAWVIYLSLLALHSNPGLWIDANGGDECLLLRRADFEEPDSSPVLHSLTQHPDPFIQAATARVIAGLRGTPSAMSRLTSSVTSSRPEGDVAPAPARLLGLIGGLWRIVVPDARVRTEEAHLRGALPEWVRDSDEFAPKPRLGASRTQRLCRRACLAASAGAAAPWFALVTLHDLSPLSSIGLSVLAVTFLNFLILLVCFRQEAAVVEMRVVLAEERLQRHSLKHIARNLSRLQRIQLQGSTRYDRQLAGLEKKRQSLELRHGARQEALENIVCAQHAVVAGRIGMLDEVEQQERVAALTKVQEEYLRTFLRRHRIWSASLPDCGWPMKAGLWISGVRTALDVDPEHAAALKRWGDKRARTVVAWRALAQAEGKRRRPRTLPPAIREPIVSRYAARRETILRGQARLVARKTAVAAALAELSGSALKSLGQREAEIRSAREARRRELDRRIDSLREQEAALHRRLHEIRLELQAYEDVSFGLYCRSVLLRGAINPVA